MPQAVKRKEAAEVIKQFQYNVVDGTGHIQLPPTSIRGFRGQIDYKAPSGLLDDLTKIQTDYEIFNFGQLLSKAKSIN